MREKIKEKKDEIISNINAINNIKKKEKMIHDNFTKALLLTLNLGFLNPRKTYSLYILSPYLNKNIDKQVMINHTLKKRNLVKIIYCTEKENDVYFIKLYKYAVLSDWRSL